MSALTPDHAEKLAAMNAAGSAGVCLCEIGAGTALWFCLQGWATITNNRQAPQRAVATRQAEGALRAAQAPELAW